MCKSNWKINNQTLDEVPENAEGFVYRITNVITGKYYIGRKSFWSRTTKKIKGRKNRKHFKNESNWRSYCSSSKLLKEDIKTLGIENFKFEILKICRTKKQMSYYENKFQFLFEVLETDTYNENILGKFFRKDI